MRSRLFLWIRGLGLTQGVDKAYFYFNKIRFFKKNRKFRKEHPSVILPRDYSIYESYRLDYKDYVDDGRETAAWLVKELAHYVSFSDKRLLDWGCGPGRVVRHLPAFLPFAKIYGADYNTSTIAWCNQHIGGVEFVLNTLHPPMPFDGDYFDIAYALSVFTHLSEDSHHEWVNELHRILKPGGVFLFTTQGSAFLSKMVKHEREQFQGGALVVRGRTKEGHRSFTAFQPEQFVRSLFSARWRVLKFTEGKQQEWGLEQDTWIVQKC